MKRHKLLISDVDYTLLGDDDYLEDFADWYARHQWHLEFVLTSGRFYESVADSIEQTCLPEPSFIIGGVGTQLRHFPSGRWINAWGNRMFGQWDSNLVRKVLSKFDRLVPQEDEFQSEFKISYFIRNASPHDFVLIKKTLREHGIGAELIYSSRRDLDVLPAGCNKGSAARFLAQYLGYAPHDVIVCGDSANDLAMFHHGFSGIVVGNAHAELMSLRSRLIYHSNEIFAAGVLDGLEYWLRGARRPKKAAAQTTQRKQALLGLASL